MAYLTPKQASELVTRLGMGEPVQALADEYKITYQAVRAWKRYIGLDAQWLKYVRDIERSHRLLTKHHTETNSLLKIASQIIRQFEPSPRLRGLMATAIRARYELTRMDANRVLGISYSAGSTTSVRHNDASLVREMKAYLADNPGQGFRKMFAVLLRDRPNDRHHALKLYREYALQFKFRRPRRIPRRVLHPMEIQGRADQVWSLDFMAGVLPNGERFVVLNGLDDYNREAMFTTVTRRSSTSAVLAGLASCLKRGRKPAVLRTDNGGEFKSKWYIAWTDRFGIQRRYIRPGKSEENAYVESFNATVRREVLNSFKFQCLSDVQSMLDDWRIRYNLGRPHSGLGGLSPVQYAHAAQIKRASI